MNKHLRILMPALLICLLAPAAVVFAQGQQPATAAPQSDAKRLSRNLKPSQVHGKERSAICPRR
jgi:hypothetical protein